MQPQYDHKIINSFYLWVEDRLARVGEASVTGITQNFVYSDLGTYVPANMYAYYSNDRQSFSIHQTHYQHHVVRRLYSL